MSAQSETFRLLQPDLWTIDELKHFLSQRGISFNGNLDKYQLLDIYKQHVMPMSQRKFPNSHQGQLINKKIIDEDKMHKKDEPKSRNDFQYGFKDKSSHSPSKQLISHQSPSTSRKDRLKPPIEFTSPPTKKICLSRRPSSDQDLDKIVINDRSKRHSESASDGSGRESTHKREKLDTDKTSSVKSHSSKKDTKERNKDRDPKEEPKPKRMRIGWP